MISLEEEKGKKEYLTLPRLLISTGNSDNMCSSYVSSNVLIHSLLTKDQN